MEGIKYLYSNGKSSTLNVKANGEGVILMSREGGYSISYSERISVKRSARDLVGLAKQKGKQKEWKKGN